MGLDTLDNLAVAIVCMIGIYFHVRILLTKRLTGVRVAIKTSCILALAVAFAANITFTFKLLPTVEVQYLFTLANWLTIPCIVTLGMSDFGRFSAARWPHDPVTGNNNPSG